ncbi:helix-turn-helix domain-containing protein, partial [Burkholderiaceae bacterium]|nr:helix-turn-helix domain-containing protein [Burkholderiaceae bacterium]
MPETIKPNVQVIERIFLLLEVLSRQGQAMSLKDISDAAGLH